MLKRTETRPIYVGNVQIGGQNQCVLQSMTNVPAKDIEKTAAQINELEENGCEIARIAVLDEEDARAIPEIKKRVHLPIVADIHFNYLLALTVASMRSSIYLFKSLIFIMIKYRLEFNS